MHNRSTQQHLEVQLPARVIDNGLANQLRVESIQNKQLRQVQDQTKQAKQELSRTQPMPSHFLQDAKKLKQ